MTRTLYGKVQKLMHCNCTDALVMYFDIVKCCDYKQVDILISKNQALQILYLKHCVYKTT